MKVILNEHIENLGRLGDIIDVKAGFARNYLLPRNKVVLPTKHNLEVMKFKQIKALKQLELEKISANELKTKLEAVTLTITKKAGESDTLFGSVTTMELQAKLEEKGFNIDRKKIHLVEHIKKLGLHVCSIKLIEEIEAEVKIEVLREGGDPVVAEVKETTPDQVQEPKAEEPEAEEPKE